MNQQLVVRYGYAEIEGQLTRVKIVSYRKPKNPINSLLIIVVIILVLFKCLFYIMSLGENPSATSSVEQTILTTKYVWDTPQGFPNWKVSGDKKWPWDIPIATTGGSLFQQGTQWTKKWEGARVRNGRYYCYKDTSTKKAGGLLTCGIGICVDRICGGTRKLTVSWKGKTYRPDRCWRSCGISRPHAMAAFFVHYQEMINELTRRTSWFKNLSLNKQVVVVDMAFNMGKGIWIRDYGEYWSNTVRILSTGGYINLLNVQPYCRQVKDRCRANASKIRG